MTGSLVLAEEFKNVLVHQFNLLDKAPGIYTVQVVRGNRD